jgi:hypothetical protein
MEESFKRTCNVAGANPLNALLKSKTCKNYVTNKEGKTVCGSFEEVYKTNGDPFKIETEDSSCSVIRSAGCFESKTECVSSIGGVCLEKRKVFSCNANSSAKKCICMWFSVNLPDGKCTSDIGQTQRDGTAQFKAATKL